jgi:hypothetical protein
MRRALSGTFYLHTAALVSLVWLAPFAIKQMESVRNRWTDAASSRSSFALWAADGMTLGVLLAITLVYLHGQTAFIYFQF